MANEERKSSGQAKLTESPRLSVYDDRVRAIRDRMNTAQCRVQIAMQFVMYPEVREELRKAQADLALALSYIGK